MKTNPRPHQSIIPAVEESIGQPTAQGITQSAHQSAKSTSPTSQPKSQSTNPSGHLRIDGKFFFGCLVVGSAVDGGLIEEKLHDWRAGRKARRFGAYSNAIGLGWSSLYDWVGQPRWIRSNPIVLRPRNHIGVSKPHSNARYRYGWGIPSWGVRAYKIGMAPNH